MIKQIENVFLIEMIGRIQYRLCNKHTRHIESELIRRTNRTIFAINARDRFAYIGPVASSVTSYFGVTK